MRYLVDHPSVFLEGVSLKQRGWGEAPKSENDLVVVVYLKTNNLHATTLILNFDKAIWLRDQLNNVIKSAPQFIDNKVALKKSRENFNHGTKNHTVKASEADRSSDQKFHSR